MIDRHLVPTRRPKRGIASRANNRIGRLARNDPQGMSLRSSSALAGRLKGRQLAKAEVRDLAVEPGG
ncbi:uncharacterized protein METZ01_LOCUS87915 [marine metagenome]|uniref:Uncharacterized protein n=1 Tax=marine metagenome TaxID=408172 RepID=A0A381V4Z8_9ZZZZ